MASEATKAPLSQQVAARLHQLMKQGPGSGDEYYRNLINWVGKIARGEEAPDGVIGELTKVVRNGDESHLFVFPAEVPSDDASKGNVPLGRREMPESILRQIEQEFGLANFELIPSTGCCGTPLVQSGGKAGIVLSIGTVVGIVT